MSTNDSHIPFGYPNAQQAYEAATREEKRLGTNCRVVELLSFMEGDRTIRVIVKKSRLGSEKLPEVVKEYETLKHYFGDLIPSQAFLSEKSEGERDLVTAFCSPVTIAYDVFHEGNLAFLAKECIDNAELQDDVDMFIVGFKKLQEQGFIVDLFGDENLVVTREGRLRYIDSFITNMGGRKSLASISIDNFKKLQQLGTL